MVRCDPNTIKMHIGSKTPTRRDETGTFSSWSDQGTPLDGTYAMANPNKTVMLPLDVNYAGLEIMMPNEKIFIADLVDNQPVETVFLVASKAVRETKNGDPYLCLTLQDRTGTIEVRAWDNAIALDSRFEADHFVAIRGRVSSYRGELQITLSDLERVEESEVNLADYLPHSKWSADELFDSLLALIEEEVESKEVRRFFAKLFSDQEFQRRYKRAPAAMSNHHNYLAGLLEHSLSMARLAVSMGRHYNAYYPGLVNVDLLVAGCIIHDMGKIEELHFKRSFEYSTAGRLLGHITIGAQWVEETAATMQPPLDPNLVMQLKHLVLSHHGRQEYGSPVTPKTAEAMLLHFLDMVDSRMAMWWNACESSIQGPGQSEGWSDYQRNLNGSLYIAGDAARGWQAKGQMPSMGSGPGLAPGLAPRESVGKENGEVRVEVEEDFGPRTSTEEDASSGPDPNLNLFGE